MTTARPVGVARGDAGQVLDPHSRPRAGCRKRYSRESRSSLPSCSCSRRSSTRWRSSGCRCSIQNSRAWRPCSRFRGNAAEVAEPVVDVRDAFAEVHLVEREAGELGARRQAGLARAKRLFGTLPLGDVDGDAHQALRLARGRGLGPPTGSDPPHATVARDDDPVLHVDGVARTRGPLDGAPNEIPVVGMDRGLETLHADDLVRRIPEDRPSPLRGPEDAGAVVQSPEPRLGGVRRQAQPRLTLPQAQLVGALASQRVGEDLRDQLQPLHQRVRPVALRPQGIEAQGADGRRASHREREGQIRLDPEQAAGSPGRRRPPPAAPPAKKPQRCGRPAFPAGARESAPGAHPRVGRQQILPGSCRSGWASRDLGPHPTTATAPQRSMPRSSQTRRSASSISRSTSPGGRLMNLDERSEISISNSRRISGRSAEGCACFAMSVPRNHNQDERFSSVARWQATVPVNNVISARSHLPAASQGIRNAAGLGGDGMKLVARRSGARRWSGEGTDQSASRQLSSGAYSRIPAASFAESGPRSFWYTVP